MSKALKDFQKHARTLATSGTFAGWRALAFELQFERAMRKHSIGSTARPLRKSWTVYAVRPGLDAEPHNSLHGQTRASP